MKSTAIYLFALLTLLCSCKSEYLTNAMFQNDVQYMAKAHSTDSVKTHTYASGVLAIHSGDQFGNAYGTAGMLNVYQSHTLAEPNLNVAYGVFGYAGNYSRTSDNNNSKSTADFSKGFSGIGGNFSISGYIPGKKADWRVLGVDVMYSKEFGDYAAFRKQGINNDDYTFYPSSRLFTWGLFSEVLIKNSDDVSLGFKLGLYNSPNQPHRVEGLPINNVNLNAVVGYRHLMFISSLKLIPTDVFLFPSGFQIGAAYRF
ncbi:hypothetical protein MUY27_19685 [Mucilaginibacter sp. RS28]|uniref:Outer membrane protein beta-barrel domain-containing protein n=1 Tax=Mucilaginibacter straminoryzae TaxID=2932774 RepID=A0A9X2BBQ4_9SPHI|nr:hypothetical protein [Mucilaginibacter straminoryzae]MCJ8211950.1 hypothetical protein [Mucilaginibacter straminoryzae]